MEAADEEEAVDEDLSELLQLLSGLLQLEKETHHAAATISSQCWLSDYITLAARGYIKLQVALPDQEPARKVGEDWNPVPISSGLSHQDL